MSHLAYASENPTTPRSREEWLSRLLAPNGSNSPSMTSASREKEEVQSALNAMRRMMQTQTSAQQAAPNLVDSLQSLQNDLNTLAQNHQKELQQQSNVRQISPIKQRTSPDSLLATIEARQNEITQGLKRPPIRAINQQSSYQTADHYNGNESHTTQNLASLGQALVEIIPNLTSNTLRQHLRQDLKHDLKHELQNFSQNFSQEQETQTQNLNQRHFQLSHDKMQALQNDIRLLTRKIEAIDHQQPQGQDNSHLEKTLFELTKLMPQLAKTLPAMQSHLNYLSERLEQSLRQPPQQNTDNTQLVAFEQKMEQLLTSLSMNMRDQSRPAPSDNSAAIDRAFSMILQKMEATDRKIEQLAAQPTRQVSEPVKNNTPIEQPILEVIAPPQVPEAANRLMERFRQSPAVPQVQAQAPVQVTHTAPAFQPRAFTKPIETGTIPQDLPLEPGSGSPKRGFKLPIPQAHDQDIPQTRISFDRPEENAANSTQESAKTSFLETLKKHKSKLLIGLAALILIAGSLKLVETLATPSPKISQKSQTLERVTSSAKVAPQVAKVAPPAASQNNFAASKEIPKEAPNLFNPNAPRAVDTTPTNSIKPLPTAPGVALNQGWQSSNPKAEAETIKSAADRGNPSAQFTYATQLFDGTGGITKNQPDALIYYQKAADQNFAPALFRLGSLYEKGIGTQKSSELARKHYLAAASLGHAMAMHNIAVMSADNSSGNADLRVASQWFKRASDYGLADSQYNLAVLYARGLGVEQSFTESYKWFALAALRGDQDAGVKAEDIAKRLSAEQLSQAKMSVETFVAKIQPASAVRVDLPQNNSQADVNVNSSFTPRAQSTKRL